MVSSSALARGPGSVRHALAVPGARIPGVGSARTTEICGGTTAMDGSKYVSDSERSDATRFALTVDREAVGVMQYASRLGHLLEWWLQGAAMTMDPLSAFRIGKRFERFRLAARLAEGKSSRQVQLALDGLRSELSIHSVPPELQSEVERARAESEKLRANSPPPPTLVRRALDADTVTETTPARPASRAQPVRLRTLALVLLAVAGIAWWASFDPAIAGRLVALFARQ
ncbi:MAG TPA: hypothetical protein VF229_03430 [Burkholderiaceae bacterium]